MDADNDNTANTIRVSGRQGGKLSELLQRARRALERGDAVLVAGRELDRAVSVTSALVTVWIVSLVANRAREHSNAGNTEAAKVLDDMKRELIKELHDRGLWT